MLLPSLCKGTLGVMFALGFTTLTGCGDKPADNQAQAPTDGHKDHKHDDHDDHAHGPHDGAVVELEGGRHAEWVVEENPDAVSVYILDEEMKKEVPIGAEKVVISVTKEGKTQTFDIPAVGGGEQASHFKLTDAPFELVGALEGDESIELLLLVPLDGKDVTAKLVPHHH